jgi:hypothetical protein
MNARQYLVYESIGNTLVALQQPVFHRPAIRVADHAIVVLEGMPGIRDDVRVPHANAKTAGLVKSAKRIVKNVRPHLESLHQAGLPKEAIPHVEPENPPPAQERGLATFSG